METITLGEVLHAIDNGERFDIEFVKADRKRGTGGQIRTYIGCVKESAIHNPASATRKQEQPVLAAASGSKNPNHYENSTRNIYLLRERLTKKVHIRLITKFNGKRVI